MNPNTNSNLEKLLLDLENPSTTPEKALELFSSTCFSINTYKKEDSELVQIFFAYMKFIITKLMIHDAHVSGMWEDIIRNTVLYSQNLSGDERQNSRIRWDYSMNIFFTRSHWDRFQLITWTSQLQIWLEEALSAPSKCPNPLIRLELFRLIRILSKDIPSISWNVLWPTFKHTITETRPCHIYPRKDADIMLFGIHDMKYILNGFKIRGFTINQSPLEELYIDIPNIPMEDNLKKFQVLLKDKDIIFICHCIRLIGIFAKNAFIISDLQFYSCYLNECFIILRDTLRQLMRFDDGVPWLTLTWNQFRKLISLSPFRHYVVETIQDLTETILIKNLGDIQINILIQIRNIIAQDLGVTTNMCDLPRLLLYRQIQSPNIVHRHSLLLAHLNTNERSEEYTDSEDLFYTLLDSLSFTTINGLRSPSSSSEGESSIGDSSNDSQSDN